MTALRAATLHPILHDGLPCGLLQVGDRADMVIVARDGQLITGREGVRVACADGRIEPDPSKDLGLLAVVNRYEPAPASMALIRGFGLKRGAIASSVAHAGPNIVGVGADRVSLARAMDAVLQAKGGLAVAAADGAIEVLPLPIAGLMSDRPAEGVAAAYQRLSASARALGSQLRAPFMTLGFMALLVIPSLKLGDRGLFDGERFEFVKPVVA